MPSVTSWLPPPGPASLLWAKSGPYSAPCVWHFVLLWGHRQGVFLDAFPPVRLPFMLPAAGATPPWTVSLLCPPAPEGSAGCECSTSIHPRTHPHTHTDTPDPSTPTGTHSEWQVLGEGGELSWQKCRGAGSHTLQGLGGEKGCVEKAEKEKKRL